LTAQSKIQINTSQHVAFDRQRAPQTPPNRLGTSQVT
jgi:hypothetical protein